MRKATLVCVLTVALLIGVGLLRQARRISSIEDAVNLVGFLFEDSTAYAPRFSEAAFKAVRPGMSQADVELLLGAPLRTDDFDRSGHVVTSGYGATRWMRYSTGLSDDANFWLRAVVLDSSGTVREVARFYWTD